MIDRRRVLMHADVIDGHEYVDLGLPSGLKWATVNIGATTPSGNGNYYQWGAGSTLYENSNLYYTGTDTTLPSSNDTAKLVWGGGWRMPTQAEWRELIDNCSISSRDSSKTVLKHKNNSNKTILFPLSGYYSGNTLSGRSSGSYTGYYWSSTSGSGTNAKCFSTILSDTNTTGESIKTISRKTGCSIRAVHD